MYTSNPEGAQETPWESIRRRPAMYVGSRDFFGFINYLVCPVALMLASGAKHISATMNDGLEISSDAIISIERTKEGRIAPFQEFLLDGSRYLLEAPILTALSKQLTVIVHTGSRQDVWQFVKGVFDSHTSMDMHADNPGTTLRFQPDPTIFNVTEVSSTIFASYFRRLSYLHKGVRFTFRAENDVLEYSAPNGIADLFAVVSSPYQLLHEPIHIVAKENDVDLEIVMAYHSWKEDHLWSFINHGRAVQGGTHEQGLHQALKRLKRKLDLPEHFSNGVVAIASIQYPKAIWQGCIKAKIGNPELRTIVSRLVFKGAMQWLKQHPDVENQIEQLQTFQFPEIWSGRL